MITAVQLTKRFDDYEALSGLDTTIPSGAVYGLIGSNGSGKSTFLRLVSGIYRPDAGSVTVGGEEVYENPSVKNRLFFVSDDIYFLPQATMDEMADFYRGYYSAFSRERYEKLCGIFPIDPKKRLHTFSKGMKRQAALVLALACQPEYLLLDEAFDGLDPVIRGAVRKVIADDMAARSMTTVITSHNLRELEDMCDHVGLLHGGRIIFEKEIDDLKLGFCKVQAAFRPMVEAETLKERVDVMQLEERGSMVSLIARGGREDVIAALEGLSPLFVEAVPLTLEEVFIHEMEAVGYDYNNVIF